VSGEKAAPVLSVAQIRPLVMGASREFRTASFCAADYRALFERGYLTVTPDYKIEVSKRVAADFGSSSTYLSLEGQSVKVPESPEKKPSRSYLEWHNKRLFLG
jgi:putative restriction endonuclease